MNQLWQRTKRRVIDWWTPLPAVRKLENIFSVFWLPVWLFARFPGHTWIAAIIFAAVFNVVAARLICDYFGWVE